MVKFARPPVTRGWVIRGITVADLPRLDETEPATQVVSIQFTTPMGKGTFQCTGDVFFGALAGLEATRREMIRDVFGLDGKAHSYAQAAVSWGVSRQRVHAIVQDGCQTLVERLWEGP